jgi:hypothetical protein
MGGRVERPRWFYPAMRAMIMLELGDGERTLDFVNSLGWARNLTIDEQYGVVVVSPSKSLYVIRVEGDVVTIAALHSEGGDRIAGVYPDAPIGSTR